LAIPNREVRFLYREIFSTWLGNQMGESRVEALLGSLIAGDSLSL
jgi:hypothetical protein